MKLVKLTQLNSSICNLHSSALSIFGPMCPRWLLGWRAELLSLYWFLLSPTLMISLFCWNDPAWIICYFKSPLLWWFLKYLHATFVKLVDSKDLHSILSPSVTFHLVFLSFLPFQQSDFLGEKKNIGLSLQFPQKIKISTLFIVLKKILSPSSIFLCFSQIFWLFVVVNLYYFLFVSFCVISFLHFK